jgi:UPF0271 protein
MDAGRDRNQIDLNCDMGEGYGTWRMAPDAELLGYVTSASIACGFHAGDPRTMDATVAAATERGVAIGAHVSYPDLVGFGRRHLRVSAEELVTDVLFQIGALHAFCRRHRTTVAYAKAHGALYNDLASDPTLAGALATALTAWGADIPALVLAGSPAVAVLEDRGIRVVQEGFADRAYRPGAVITDVEEVARRAGQLAARLPLTAVDGAPVVVAADSVCVHGDTPGSVALARRLREVLAAQDIDVRPFA